MEVEKSKNERVVLTIDPPTTNTKPNIITKQYSPKPQPPENHQDQLRTSASPKILRRLNFSKPRSRFEEITHPLIPPNKISEYFQELQPQNDTTSSDDDDDEWYDDVEVENEDIDEDDTQGKHRKRRHKRKMNKRVVIEWALFLIIMTCLICSLTLDSLKHKRQWSLEIWKWCLMIMVVFCGRLVSGWVVGFAVFLIEKNFMLKEKVLYFVYGLRKSFQNCVWLALVLIAWMIMFPDVHKHNKFLKKVFRFLIAILVGATIWLLKILFVKVLASSFHVATFFDRMKESVFHHYILDALSGPPLDEDEREEPRLRRLRAAKSMPARLRGRKQPQPQPQPPLQHDVAGVGSGNKRIDMEKLRRLSRQRRATAWSVKRLVNYVRSSGLSTISRTVDDFGNAESEITSEWEARNTAKRIFKNVAKPAAKLVSLFFFFFSH